MELLQAFSPERPSWQLYELQRHLGWNKATTYRFLTALADLRMLDRRENGEYQLGMLPLELAAVYISSSPGRRLLASQLPAIADKTGLTTQLCVLEGDAAVVVGSSEGGRALRVAAELGQRLPLHATAAGKAMLSQLSDDFLESFLPEELEVFSDRTVSKRSELIQEIRDVRAHGVARAESELLVGLKAVAVPIPFGFFAPSPTALACAGPALAEMDQAWGLAETELCEVRDVCESHDRLINLSQGSTGAIGAMYQYATPAHPPDATGAPFEAAASSARPS